MKIYVASSWRNVYQPRVVELLGTLQHEVYDFRHPKEGNAGFAWEDISENWKSWTTEDYIKALNTGIANDGHGHDYAAMQWADVCVVVMPCGRSSHVEAGWFAGKDKPVYVYIPEPQEPELMYKMFAGIISTEMLLIRTFAQF